MAIVFATTLLCLLCIRFFGSPERPQLTLQVLGWLSPQKAAALAAGLKSQLTQRVYWAGFRMLFYGVVPLLTARFLLRVPLGELGLRLRNTREHAHLYLGIIALLAPIVVAASFGAAFQHKYPYYHVGPNEALWPRFWLWEILYATQFVALEFFFRGFMLHGLVPRFGFGTVPVMMIPYMMIHYGKPLPEALGSIIAGFTLGCLSLKSRSIYWGALVHICVACGMDLLSLWHAGRL